MNHFSFRHWYDFYEVEHNQQTILKIRKLTGDSQHPQDLRLSECQEEVQNYILERISNERT